MFLMLLDLEETVIDNWSNKTLLEAKLSWIRGAIEGMKRNQKEFKLGLLSAAVSTDEELKEFNTRLRPILEEKLGHPFDDRWVLGLKGWASEVWKTRGMKIELEDFWDLVQKPELLFLLSQSHPEWEKTTVALVDDAFADGLTIEVPSRQCRSYVININQRVPINDVVAQHKKRGYAS